MNAKDWIGHLNLLPHPEVWYYHTGYPLMVYVIHPDYPQHEELLKRLCK